MQHSNGGGPSISCVLIARCSHAAWLLFAAAVLRVAAWAAAAAAAAAAWRSFFPRRSLKQRCWRRRGGVVIGEDLPDDDNPRRRGARTRSDGVASPPPVALAGGPDGLRRPGRGAKCNILVVISPSILVVISPSLPRSLARSFSFAFSAALPRARVLSAATIGRLNTRRADRSTRRTTTALESGRFLAAASSR